MQGESIAKLLEHDTAQSVLFEHANAAAPKLYPTQTFEAFQMSRDNLTRCAQLDGKPLVSDMFNAFLRKIYKYRCKSVIDTSECELLDLCDNVAHAL